MTNIIILTHGWTGSSVFAALLGRAGYWLGADTVRKVDYNTNENTALVDLNRRLLRDLAPGVDHEHHYSDADVAQIDRAAAQMDLEPLRGFVAECNQHGPWLWKDPRLTWTMGAWARVIDPAQVSYLILTRDTAQAWVSSNLRRHVQSLRFTREYNDGITRSNLRFVRATGRPCLALSFEDLLLRPQPTLDALNRCFGTALTLDDLCAVCDQPLHRKSRGVRDFVLAALIYLKNFGERDGRGRRVARGTP